MLIRFFFKFYVGVCVPACACMCVHACVHACVRVPVRGCVRCSKGVLTTEDENQHKNTRGQQRTGVERAGSLGCDSNKQPQRRRSRLNNFDSRMLDAFYSNITIFLFSPAVVWVH